jgi:hypothetical protein
MYVIVGAKHLMVQARLPDGTFAYHFLVYFGGPWSGKRWYIYGHLVYFMATNYTFWLYWYI